LGLLLALFPALSLAQEKAPGEKEEPAKGANVQDYLSGAETAAPESNEYITFDVKDKDLNEVLRFISRRVGVNIIADPEVKEKVTIQLDRVEWRNALNVIAKQTHCKIVEVSDRLLRFTQPPSISMEFQDADIKVVLDLLAKQSGANIVIASDVQGKVSLSLREVPWREALQTVVETAGYTTVKTDGANEILRVVRPESLKDQLDTEYFQLLYIRPSDDYRAIAADIEKYAVSQYAGQGSSGSLDNKGGTPKEKAPFSLEEALRETLSKDGSLKYDEHTNTLIVKDTKPKLDQIREVIKRVDVRPPQVYVEVKFIRTTNQDILERGIKFDLPATPERDGFQVIGRAPDPNPFATDPLDLIGGTFPFDLARPDNIIEDFHSRGVLDFTQTQLLLKLLKDDENSRIVQEPTLTMLDNKPATIFVGEEVPFAVQKIQSDQNGNITVAIEENKRSPVNVGFTLYLTPHVISGTDMINLTIIPKVSALSGTTSPISGFERFEFSTDTSTTIALIDLPRQALQTVVTYMRVFDGHTAVIGGLQTERKTEIQTQIPLLSSIPIIGNLFTWKRKKNNTESMIILITPHIVKNAGEDDLRTDLLTKKHQDKDYFYNKYEKIENPPKKAASTPTSGGGADKAEK
jgi:type IV pilus assembly protein PilQ